MSLPIPGVGTEPGPQYATDVDNCLTIVDAHTHNPGSGVQITPTGLNINADLSMQSNNLTLTRSIRFAAQGTTFSSGSDLGCVYEVGVDLYYRDGNGNNVRITQNGAVSGTPGSIANLVSPASASYNSSTQTFIWQSAANTAANLDAGSVIIRPISASAPGVTISAPSGLGANYTLTLPSAPPSSTQALLMSSSGNVNPGLIDIAQLTTLVAQSLNPAGTIIAFAGPTTPAGYLYCNGAVVSIASYPNLYAAIGTAWGYGNNDGLTFNLPNTQGLFLRGLGGGYDPDYSSRGAVNPGGGGGDSVGSLQLTAVIQHQHALSDPGHKHSVNVAQAGSTTITPSSGHAVTNPINASTETTDANVVITTTTGISVGNVSGGAATSTGESRPPNVYVQYCIKY
jgi:microcystin-dependent protein